MTKNATLAPLSHRNVGTIDRALRALGGSGFIAAAIFAPWPLWVRVFALGGTGVYLGFTALAGTCLGYRLMGRSTCPVDAR